MSKITFKYKDVVEYAKKTNKAAGGARKFIEKYLYRVAAKIVRQAIKLTPPPTTGEGEYKPTGLLRASYTISEPVWHDKTLHIYIVNTAEYASFVEYGHYTRDRKRWITGLFMLTISMSDIADKMKADFEPEYQEFIKNMGLK